MAFVLILELAMGLQTTKQEPSACNAQEYYIVICLLNGSFKRVFCKPFSNRLLATMRVMFTENTDWMNLGK